MKTNFRQTKLCFALSSILIASSLQPMALAYMPTVGAGQISSGETVDGPQTIEQGGQAEHSIVTGFGQQNVTGQGSSSNHGTIENGGKQTITDGAVANGMLVLGNGQSAIYHGTQTIGQDGLATNTRLENVGQQFIEGGGRADNAELYDLSRQTIQKDGVANQTLLDNSHQDVYGIANHTTVRNDGRQLIGDGGVANDSEVTGLGWQTITKGGTANGTNLSNVAGQNVNGGMAKENVINDGATQNINGGTATDNTIKSGAVQNVNNGGAAQNTSVEKGGVQNVNAGGQAEQNTISGGHQIISGEGALATTNEINQGGFQIISNGGQATGTNVTGTGIQFVNEDGHAEQTYLTDSARQMVDKGGSVSDTTLDGAHQMLNNAYAKDTKAYNGAIQEIRDSIAEDNFIGNDSVQQVIGGQAINNTIDDGGKQWIIAGGHAENTIVAKQGEQEVADGTAHDNKIFGLQNISGGTATKNTIEEGGRQSIIAGGKANDTTVKTGGLQDVADGTATNNTIKDGAIQSISGGTANQNMIEGGGVQTIIAGGKANQTTVLENGIQNVRDGIATDNIISGQQNVNGGTANNNTIEDGGKQIITAGGQANQTMVEKGGEQHVIDGIATTNIINTGGLQNIEHQGIAQDNNISGTQNVAGGTANNNTLYNGGVQNVSQGGQANTNVINNGGIQNVNDGTATGNTIAAGGTQNIGNAGHAIDSTIYGQQEVAAEGIITNTVVEGGLSYLHEGAQSTGNLTINNGGLLAVNATTVTDRTVDGVSIDSNSQMVVINQTGEEGFLTVGDMVNDGMVIINGFHSLNGESDTTRPFEDFVVVHADTLAGQGSILMHTDIGQQKGDLLSVGRLDAAAQQSLDVQNNAASDVTVNDRLTVVTTDSGGQAGQFALSHAVEQGGYQFGLRQINEGKDWELYALDQNVPPPVDPGKPVGPNRPVLSSTADAAANSIVSTYLANFVDTQTLLHRMGELREGQNHVGLWGRAYGGKLDSFGNGLLSGFNMKYYSMQLGADYQVNLEHSRVYFGGAVSYLHGDQDFHKVANYLAKGEVQTTDRDGDGTLKNYNAYLYATYMTDQNFYVDTILKYGHMRSKFGVKDSAGANVSGHSSLNLYGLSAEVGQRFYLEGDQNFYVTPQVQLTYTHFGTGTYKASNGLNVKVKSRDSWLGRVGAELGYQFKSENPVNVYARASYLKEFSNDGDFMLNHSRESYSMKGHWWQYEVGINAKIGQQHNVYFNVNYNKGQRFNQKQLNIGYRYEF
ncbi:autotransporter outer membrane beta-barrel domain-containing protein [Wohlfahrtiimonas chitiniclastica]|uniref:autotransporter outer membrane beta-barrel domain-containing protein n=1 Tax=Wohlfahrtiimonas chitiniclastica TaxID=400946 RepID=UPI0007B69895|nr:autotransporter outer membrane beta-barrel domain-containing protein [Wohlfahrtiimonas chitiniclastica]KZX37088.1 hypothetical protein A6V30_05235 [Wohlfahrtiimonas chitiniclastica]